MYGRIYIYICLCLWFPTRSTAATAFWNVALPSKPFCLLLLFLNFLSLSPSFTRLLLHPILFHVHRSFLASSSSLSRCALGRLFLLLLLFHLLRLSPTHPLWLFFIMHFTDKSGKLFLARFLLGSSLRGLKCVCFGVIGVDSTRIGFCNFFNLKIIRS